MKAPVNFGFRAHRSSSARRVHSAAVQEVRTRSDVRVRLSGGVALILTLLAFAACSDDPPALRIGDAAFHADELTGVPSSALPALADLTAWGLLVREGEVDSLLEPIAARVAERGRLASLPYVLGADSLGMDDDDLREAYATRPEWELEVRHVIRMVDADALPAERVQALEEAEEVLRRARAGDDFAALAAEFSEEPGAAERGGLLQPGRRGSWVAPFWEAAAALEAGEVSPVVESEYGFHVIRLEDRSPVPFEEADRAALLRQVVPLPVTEAAMSAWVAASPEPTFAATSAADLLSALDADAPAAALGWDAQLAAAGEERYTGADLALSWAALEPEARRSQRGDPTRFEAWWQADARELLRARMAADHGAPADDAAARLEMARLRGQAAAWTQTLGFAEGMGVDGVRARAIEGVTRSGQELSIARDGLRGLRPLLRRARPVDQPG